MGPAGVLLISFGPSENQPGNSFWLIEGRQQTACYNRPVHNISFIKAAPFSFFYLFTLKIKGIVALLSTVLAGNPVKEKGGAPYA